MLHAFIVNPIAGKGKALKTIPVIKSLFESRPDLKRQGYSIFMTKHSGHASEIAAELVEKGVNRIYSVGGDGTLNEIVNGMCKYQIMKDQATLGIIPAGSGNDFLKSIILSGTNNSDNDSSAGDGLPLKMEWPNDLGTIIEKTIYAPPEYFDYAIANDRFFVNAASMGFDAEIAHNTNILKRKYPIPTNFAYYAGILKSIFRNYQRELEIDIDGTTIQKTTLMVVIANGKFYGNGIPIAPKASINDSLLDICIIDWCTRARILSVLPQVLKGKIESLPEFTHIRGKNVKIRSLEKLYLNYDGEITETYEASLRLCNTRLKIAVPNLR